MPYSTRLATSVHILLAIYHFENKEKVTSTFLANSIQTNPVIVRNLLGKLQRAGLVKVDAGIGGAHLLKDPENLTFWDIFQAVEESSKIIFKPHEDTNPDCEVGRVVHSILDPQLEYIHNQLVESLKTVTLSSLIKDMEDKISQEADD